MSSFLYKLGIGKDKNKDKIGNESVKSLKSSKTTSSSSTHHHSHQSHNGKFFSSSGKKNSLKEISEIPISPIPNSAGSTPKKETSSKSISSKVTETPLKSNVTSTKISNGVDSIKEVHEEVKETPKDKRASVLPPSTVEKKKVQIRRLCNYANIRYRFIW